MKILLSGRLDFGPMARHLRAFLETLSKNKENEIYIDSYYINLFRADFFGTQELLNYYLQFDNVKLSKSPNEYDIGIFTDLLTLQYNDIYYKHFLLNKFKIKICYEVFDGSIPPLDWIDIINDNFDICSSPSAWVRDRLVKYGVKIPCFHLPCVVFNDDLLQMKPKKKSIYRFGFVGGAEQRKNLLKVIQAFHMAFKNNTNVELYIHSAYSPEEDYINVCKYLVNEYQKFNNITFNLRKPLGTEEMYDLISSFDFYIFPTKVTGYFTTPCEALSVGIPIVISDIPVHQELTANLSAEDGVFLIKAKELDVMIHSYLGHKCLGAQFDMSAEEIAEQMLKAYSYKEKIFSIDKIEKRKQTARKYSLESLTKNYLNFIKPNNFILSNINHITEDNFYCNDRSLIKKFKSINNQIKIDKRDLTIQDKYYINNEKKLNIIEDICRKIELDKISRLIPTPIIQDEFSQSKYLSKIKEKAKKYHAKEFPFLAYKLASFCFKLKRFFSFKN